MIQEITSFPCTGRENCIKQARNRLRAGPQQHTMQAIVQEQVLVLAQRFSMEDLTIIRELSGSNGLILERDEPHLWSRLQPTLKEHWRFFAAFLRRPATVGSLVPSSVHLAQAVLERCNLKSAKTVVELGSGTGAITRFILERLGRHTTFLALELDPVATRELRQRFPELVVYSDSAEHLQKYLARHGRKKVDCVISGLPWANMTAETQERILAAVFRVLKPGGMFTTFAYLHASWLPTARRFRERLARHFGTVKVSPTVWRNFPPAYVYRCR